MFLRIVIGLKLFHRWRPFNKSRHIFKNDKEVEHLYLPKFLFNNDVNLHNGDCKKYSKIMQICNMVGVEVVVIIVETKVRIS